MFASDLRTGPRPEEDVATEFLVAVLRGDAGASYDMTIRGYRSLVFPSEHAELVAVLAGTAGEAELDVLGSERTPGSRPLESLVGYRAVTDAGPLEGVVTLFRTDDGWEVADYSYDFTAPPPGATDALDELTRLLNDQLVDRARRAEAPPAPGR